MPAPGLDLLRTVITVHRIGSFSGAARMLGISQPTVTAHVAALEEHFGYLLFTRLPRGVQTTARGEELVSEVAPSIDALDDLVAFAGARDAIDAPSIHLAGPAEFMSAVVLPRITRFDPQATGPVRVTFGLADELLEQLREGAHDLVVSSIRPRVRGITAAPLFDEEFVLVAAPRWIGDANIDRLESIPVVAYAEHLPIVRRYWRSVFGRRPDGLAIVAIIPDLRGILAAIVDGAGMSVLPRYLVERSLRTGELVVVHTPEVAPLNTLYLATRAGDIRRRAAVRAAADVLVTVSSEV
jgi:DNA-binding transcriptional LysR family regulator